MRTLILRWLAFAIPVLGMAGNAEAATTIDAANSYAYGANIGWLDWRADKGNGAVIGEYVCSGYIYSANVGWINLGSGSPSNGIYYKNSVASDFGVNQDGDGNLSGYAYGANIGWIVFEATGAPKVDLLTGQFSGYVWSANCGWISLSNATAVVQTDSIQQGTLGTNGLPVAWSLQNFGTTAVDPNGDPDGDGASNADEYLAGTNPNDGSDTLRITAAAFGADGTNCAFTWNSVANRYYYLQKEVTLSLSWADSGLGLINSGGTSSSASFSDTNAPTRFFRVQAVRPLML